MLKLTLIKLKQKKKKKILQIESYFFTGIDAYLGKIAFSIKNYKLLKK